MSLGSISCMMPLPRSALANLDILTIAVLNPVEVIKIRLQLQGERELERDLSAAQRIYGSQRQYRGTLHSALQIIRQEQLAGLYKGFLPALMREAIYAGFRMGAYEPLKKFFGAKDAQFPLWKKILCGSIAGMVGAAIATPTDVVKVRMQADMGTPPRYSSTFSAFSTIARTEGILGLWKGVGPTTQRAAVISAAMLPSYDHSKYLLLQHGWLQRDDIYAHASAAMIAGFLMTLVSNPIDVVKTRLMNERQRQYSGALDCFWKTLRNEGILGLYKGFLPAYFRLGPHTLMAFVLFERLRKLVGYEPL